MCNGILELWVSSGAVVVETEICSVHMHLALLASAPCQWPVLVEGRCAGTFPLSLLPTLAQGSEETQEAPLNGMS